jgi:hypothetical protein
MPKKYQIHLKSQNGPIHVLLVNKDASADSPVVTPVPPPVLETNGTNVQLKQEPMETESQFSSLLNQNASAGTSENVKTEVVETSQGIFGKVHTCIYYGPIHASFLLSKHTGTNVDNKGFHINNTIVPFTKEITITRKCHLKMNPIFPLNAMFLLSPTHFNCHINTRVPCDVN